MTIKKIENQRYFHGYATANDFKYYIKDIYNLKRIKKHHSGLENIELYIAISEVRDIGFFDGLFVKYVRNLFHNHDSIVLKDISFKNNIGRDFSSFQLLYQKISKVSDVNDYIFFQNRSGVGPFSKNWYSSFVHQFEKFDSIAICGSTINFMDHTKRSSSNSFPHIQTYSFLTKVSYLNMISDDFPGVLETKRMEIICNGEIRFSDVFLEKGYNITCLEWPNEPISKDTEAIVSSDIKRKVKAFHYFYHREYFKKNMPFKFVQLLGGIETWFGLLYSEFINKK